MGGWSNVPHACVRFHLFLLIPSRTNVQTFLASSLFALRVSCVNSQKLWEHILFYGISTSLGLRTAQKVSFSIFIFSRPLPNFHRKSLCVISSILKYFYLLSFPRAIRVSNTCSANLDKNVPRFGPRSGRG